MTKKILGGARLLKNATKEAKKKIIDLNGTVLMTYEQIATLSQPKERKTAGKIVYLIPSEMKGFFKFDRE